MDREPFTRIDAPETLSPAGELLYEAMQLIETIIQSPTVEPTHEQQLADLLEQLHRKHDYPTETIQIGLVETAQQWGDLPIDPRRVL